ncbi:AbrB/MazE/SpoVT family DNA-binding domain-containing protein [Vulcanisaeta thermophila]|uniref:AbrB/MazE/SpoVT family DNA-binding domain-containing protein n=1 Tax=Vulcanisaeta thermophila TaxID=867917 RepID=UPI000852B582|nr:AbrB/MazE/SpoVT family DNA-binding domain-containing protein [Vulcanisaeta thermophila]
MNELRRIIRRTRREITQLPYIAKVYINNQVLIPASLIKALGIEHINYANIVLEYNGIEIVLKHVKLLRTKHTASRQFTIPKDVREKYGIKPLDMVKIKDIKPSD